MVQAPLFSAHGFSVWQRSSAAQTRSEVAEGATDSSWPAGHSYQGAQILPEVALTGAIWYVPEAQAGLRMQWRSVVVVAGTSW